MACGHGHAHLIVFAHACGYYSRVATNRGAVSIRINTVVAMVSDQVNTVYGMMERTDVPYIHIYIPYGG